MPYDNVAPSILFATDQDANILKIKGYISFNTLQQWLRNTSACLVIFKTGRTTGTTIGSIASPDYIGDYCTLYDRYLNRYIAVSYCIITDMDSEEGDSGGQVFMLKDESSVDIIGHVVGADRDELFGTIQTYIQSVDAIRKFGYTPYLGDQPWLSS